MRAASLWEAAIPTDSNGVYSLPSGYEVTNGTPTDASQHNAPLEDIETAITGRLPRNGAAAMTGPLKLDDGTAAAPSLTLASVPGAGFYKSGTKLAPVNVLGTIEPGMVIDFAGTTAPTGWLLCYGQSLLRASYQALFDAIGTTYGSADGTHFNVPDCRGLVSAGKDDMGGTSANRLTNADDGLNGDTLGATGGNEVQTFVQANLPNVNFAVSGITLNDPTHVHGGIPTFTASGTVGGVGSIQTGTGNSSAASTGITISNQGSAASGGTSQAFGIIQPTIIFNKIIFTGVV